MKEFRVEGSASSDRWKGPARGGQDRRRRFDGRSRCSGDPEMINNGEYSTQGLKTWTLKKNNGYLNCKKIDLAT